MKKILDADKFNLGDVLKRGLSVRDEIVNEFNVARSKFAKVNWQDEIEAFKNNPIDTAQSYLTQVNEVLRSRTEEQSKGEDKSTVKAPETKPVTSRKPRVASAKSPRAKKPAAKKPAAKKSSVKTATPRRSTAAKAKTASTVGKTATAK